MTLYQWLHQQGIKPQSLLNKRVNLLQYTENSKRPQITGYNYDNMGRIKEINKYKIVFENGSQWFAGEQIDSEYKSNNWKIEVIG